MKVLKKVVAIMLMLAMMTSVIGVKEETKAAQVDYTTLAQELALDNNWSESWITEDDDTEHWYRVSVPADGRVVIKMMAYMNYMNWHLYTADLSKTIQDGSYFGGTETAPQTVTIDKVLSAGTYYLKIREDNHAGKYRLCGSFENYGANDSNAYSFDSPQVLSENTVITGALTETDEEDWYRFTVGAPGVYTIKTVSYHKYLDFHLYNSDMTKTIADASYYYGSETAPATKTFDVTLGAGNYYIKINTGDCGKYLVSWTKLTQASCTHDYNNTYVGATFLAGGYTEHVCEKCGHSLSPVICKLSADAVATGPVFALLPTFGLLETGRCFVLFPLIVPNKRANDGSSVSLRVEIDIRVGIFIPPLFLRNLPV